MIMEEVSDYVMRRIWKKFLVPSVISRVSVYAVSSLCSFFLISRYCGKNELVVFSMFAVVLQLKKAFDAYWGNGSAQEFSRLKGAEKPDVAQNVFSETVTGYLLIGGTLYCLLCLLVPWMVTDLFHLQELREMGISFGVPFIIYLFYSTISYVLLLYIAYDGMPQYNATISLVGNCSMLVFQIIFIGFMRLNMKGYLYAGFLSETIISVCCLFIFLFSKQATLRVKFRLPRLSTLYSLWLYSCGALMNKGLCFVAYTFVMRWILNGYGRDVVAIYALGRQCNSLVYAVSCGYLDAIQMLASMFRGEKNRNGLLSTWRRGFFYGMRTQFILVAVMFIFAPLLVKYMLSPSINFDQAVWGVRIMIVFLIFSFPMDFRVIFYNACGHAKLVSICSICNQVLIHTGSMAFFYFFGIAEKWFWFSWAADRVGEFLLVALMAEVWRRRNKFTDRMLLAPEQKRTMLAMIMKDSPQELQDYRLMLGLFMKKNGLTEKQIKRAELLFEELFLFAAEKTKDLKQSMFFIYAKIEPGEKIKIDLKYDSKESCFNSVLNLGKYNVSLDKVLGAKILHKLSDFIRIDRVLGINVVSIEVDIRRPSEVL